MGDSPKKTGEHNLFLFDPGEWTIGGDLVEVLCDLTTGEAGILSVTVLVVALMSPAATDVL